VTKLLRQIVTVNWKKAINDEAKAFLIKTARAGHQDIMRNAAAAGLFPTWEAYANNPGNSNLDTVVLPGPIVYNYRYLSDLIQFALDELRRQSPAVSGAYKNGHTLYVNDQPVGDVLPKNITAGDRIFIANPLPYARKIEVGRTESGREFVINPPNRLYNRVMEMVKAQGKGRANISMRFVDLGAWTLRHNQRSRIKTAGGKYRFSARQRDDRLAGAVVTSPAIFFQAPI
jgi:hypothetical protein